MIRAFLSRRAEWPARVTDPGAPPRLGLLWREAAALFQAFGGRIRPLPPEPNPDSDHPPVMVLPGFLSGDWATRALRADLRRAGFRCYAWGLGFNRGATPDIIERIDGRVQWIIDRTGRAPALVGWSLGGIYAREYAKHYPDRVARVVTLGSPFSGGSLGCHVSAGSPEACGLAVLCLGCRLHPVRDARHHRAPRGPRPVDHRPP